MRNEGESAPATTGKLTSSKKRDTLKQSENVKNVEVPTLQSDQAARGFDLPSSPTEGKAAKKTAQVKPKAALKKNLKANTVKKTRAIGEKGQNGLDLNKIPAFRPNPRRSARNHVRYSVSGETQQGTSEDEDGVSSASEQPHKHTQRASARKSADEIEDDERGQASSEIQTLQAKGKGKELRQPVVTENSHFKVPSKPAAPKMVETHKPSTEDIVDSPQNRKPNLISFSASGPRNQGTTPTLKRQMKPSDTQEQPEKRVKRAAIEAAESETIADVAESAMEMDNLFPAPPSAESQAQSNHDEDEMEKTESREFFNPESPHSTTSQELSGSQLSKRVDGNGSPYNTNVQLQVSSRASRSDVRQNAGEDDDYQDTHPSDLRDLTFPTLVEPPVHAAQTQQQDVPNFNGHDNNVSEIVVIREAIQTISRSSQLSNPVTQSLLSHTGALPIKERAAIEQAREVYVPKKVVASRQEAIRVQHDHKQTIQALTQLAQGAKTLPRADVIQRTRPPVTNAEPEWDEAEETLLNDESTLQQREVLATHGFNQGQMYERPYHDSSTPSSSTQHTPEHDKVRSVSVSGHADARTTTIKEAVIWEHGLSLQCRSVAESLMRITKVCCCFD